MIKKQKNKRGLSGKDKTSLFHREAAEDMYNHARRCAGRGFPESYDYFLRKHRYHSKLY